MSVGARRYGAIVPELSPDARPTDNAPPSESQAVLVCVWCRRSGRVCDADTVPGGDAALTGLVLCATCEYLDGAGADLWDEEGLDAQTDAAQETFEAALRQRYRDGDGDGDGDTACCWWCGRPGEQLPLENWRDGELVYESPTLCEACAGLSGHVSFGFDNAHRAWVAARKTLIEAALGT
jgi:hypothetical protein